jgi:hypothetical protein
MLRRYPGAQRDVDARCAAAHTSKEVHAMSGVMIRHACGHLESWDPPTPNLVRKPCTRCMLHAATTPHPPESTGADAPARSSYDIIIDEVARRFGVRGDQLRAHDRRPHIAVARHAAFWALRRAGLTPACIARHFGMHHSTVVHGLARAARHPDWQEAAAPAVLLATVGGPRTALTAWLERGLRGLPPSHRRAIEAYATCTLTGWQRHTGATCAAGLLIVLSNNRARAALEEALRRCDLAPLIASIALHARQLERSIA